MRTWKRIMERVSVASAFLVLGWAGAARAQVGTGTGPVPPGLPVSITGRVWDGSSVSLAGVTVTLTGTASRTVQTDSSGRFVLDNLARSGTYTVTLTKSGYTFVPPAVTLANLLGAMDLEFGFSAASCAYVLDLVHNFPFYGATRTPNLTTGAGCPWTTSVPTQQGETYASVTPGSGSGTITLSVLAPSRSYSIAPRVGSIRAGGGQGTVDEQVTRFTQAATDLHPYFYFNDLNYGEQSYDPNGSQGFANYIALLKSSFITAGCTVTDFCATNGVTKEQIAAFLIRAMFRQPGDCEVGSSNPTQPTCYQTCKHGYPYRPDNTCGFTYGALPEFDDVNPDDNPSSPTFNTFFAYIQKLKELGLAQDCGFRQFCPTALINRGQMAQFLISAKYGSQFNYPSTPYFTDVPPAYFSYVQKLRQQGITAGTTTTLYSPNDYLIRTQMAVFLVRTFLTLP